VIFRAEVPNDTREADEYSGRELFYRVGDALMAVDVTTSPRLTIATREIGRVSRAFANDIRLALSCRETGCVFVTVNGRDFQRIRRYGQRGH
jgi:hypothetical protein